MVIFTTLETSSELFPLIVSGLAQVLLFGVLFGLLEELLELSGELGHISVSYTHLTLPTNREV